MMESLRQENKILYRILERASIKFLCPLCFKGYSRTDRLYGHFRAANADEIHAGLDPRIGDFARFHSCFQQAMKISISTRELFSLTEGGKCFEVAFVIQRYDKDPQNMTAKGDYQDLNTGTLPANHLPELILNAFAPSIFINSYHSPIRARAVPSILCSHILGSPAATGYYASLYHKPASWSRISPRQRYTQHRMSKVVWINYLLNTGVASVRMFCPTVISAGLLIVRMSAAERNVVRSTQIDSPGVT